MGGGGGVYVCVSRNHTPKSMGLFVPGSQKFSLSLSKRGSYIVVYLFNR